MRIAGHGSVPHGIADLLQLALQDVSRNAGQHQQKFVPAVADLLPEEAPASDGARHPL